MEKTIAAAAGAAVGLVMATGSAHALIAPPKISTDELMIATATEALSTITSMLVRGAPQRAGAGAVDLASRGATLSMTGLLEDAGPRNLTFSSQGGADLRVTPWAEILGVRAEDLSRTYDAQVLEIGLDAATDMGLTFGASIAVVRTDVGDAGSGVAVGTGQGEGYIFGLSAAYESGPWSADAVVRFSQTDYEQDYLGTSGTSEEEGVALRVSAAYAFDLANGATLSPMASIVSGRTEVTGTGGALAGFGSREFTYTEASLGAMYAQDVGFGTVSVGVFADNFQGEGDQAQVLLASDREGTSGRIEMGLDLALGAASDLSLGLSYGGLGSDTEVVQGALGVSFRF